MKALPIETCLDCPRNVFRLDARCFHPAVRMQNLNVPRPIEADDEPFPAWCPLPDWDPEKGAN